jgi:hypothetical protein
VLTAVLARELLALTDCARDTVVESEKAATASAKALTLQNAAERRLFVESKFVFKFLLTVAVDMPIISRSRF